MNFRKDWRTALQDPHIFESLCEKSDCGLDRLVSWKIGREAPKPYTKIEIENFAEKFYITTSEIYSKLLKLFAEDDIMKLISIGAPEDEYSFEVIEFLKQVEQFNSIDDIAKQLYLLFSFSFDKVDFTIHDFKSLASKIKEIL